MKFNKFPFSEEAEQSVLGSLLIDNNSLNKIINFINPEYFYKKKNKIIFIYILKLINKSKYADVITLYGLLSNNGLGKKINLSYLNFLVENTTSPDNIYYYAEIIREKGILRKLLYLSKYINKISFNNKGKKIKKILNNIEKQILSITLEESKGNEGYTKLQLLFKNIIKQVNKSKNNKNNITGLSTGFKDLDKITSGLQLGDLIIIAGRPSMGKTAFSMNIGEYIAINTKLPVIIFSMEMSNKQLAMRILSSIGKINQNRIKNGNLLKKDWIRLTKAIKIFKKIKLYIDETAYLNIIEIRSKSKKIINKYGKIGLIIIDYLQLMSSNNKYENRSNEISDISRNLKILARELNCPIIALSQLNRYLEQRINKKPIMSDLRESGALEQDADLILFIYRDEIYYENSPYKGTAEIIIGKQRNGPIGSIRLSFIGKYTKYKNYNN